MYASLSDFVCLVLLLPFGLGFYMFFFSLFGWFLLHFFLFLLPFLSRRVAGRVLVLRPGEFQQSVQNKVEADKITKGLIC